MSRRLLPANQALQDRIEAVLADAWPDMLTSSQIAERVGGMRTVWEVCMATRGYTCRVGRNGQFPATHHPGPVPQDSWEVPWNAMDMNPPLNRLAREDRIRKVKVQALRAVLWSWAGDSADDNLTDAQVLEQMWSLEQ